MDPTKERKILDGACAVLALISLAGAAYTVVTGQIFSTGVDGLFFAMMCLLLAIVFAISPVWSWLSGRAAAGAGSHAAAGHAASVPNGLFLPVVGDEHAHVPTSADTKKNFMIWVWLLALTAIEVVLGYVQVASLGVMLFILMALSIVKAALIMAYFMHLKFERRSLILTVVPAMVVCIALLAIIFPDSLRALLLRAVK
jgi:cytochrome c oxidase subunit 4